MYYVYIIRSVNFSDKTYVGYTEDLKKRLSNHNSGSSPHTSKYMPWEIETVIGFKNKFTAIEFEIYLKSHSGRAFAAKRFLN